MIYYVYFYNTSKMSKWAWSMDPDMQPLYPSLVSFSWCMKAISEVLNHRSYHMSFQSWSSLFHNWDLTSFSTSDYVCKMVLFNWYWKSAYIWMWESKMYLCLCNGKHIYKYSAKFEHFLKKRFWEPFCHRRWLLEFDSVSLQYECPSRYSGCRQGFRIWWINCYIADHLPIQGAIQKYPDWVHNFWTINDNIFIFHLWHATHVLNLHYEYKSNCSIYLQVMFAMVTQSWVTRGNYQVCSWSQAIIFSLVQSTYSTTL